MRLATVNLRHGRSSEDGPVDLARVAVAVAALDADVVALQEVDRGQPRSGGADQVAAIAAACGATACFVPTLVGVPGTGWRPARAGELDIVRPSGPARAHPDGPWYGVALLVRVPVRSWHVLRLAPASARSPAVVGRTRRIRRRRDEPRAVVAAVLDRPGGPGRAGGSGGPLTVAGAHLSVVRGWNVVQLRRTVAALRDLPGPRVLLGDLNLPGPVPSRATGWRPMVEAPTFPAHAPRVQADHVLVDDPSGRLVVRATEVVVLPFSDHRALVVDVDVR